LYAQGAEIGLSNEVADQFLYLLRYHLSLIIRGARYRGNRIRATWVGIGDGDYPKLISTSICARTYRR